MEFLAISPSLPLSLPPSPHLPLPPSPPPSSLIVIFNYFYIVNRQTEMNNPFDKLLPEEKLLLRLCRLEFSAAQKEEIATLVKQVSDWDQFVRLANEHGIIALCWNNIVALRTDDNLPASCLEQLHKGYLASVARNTRIFSLLGEVAGIAKDEGIDLIILKGLALEKTIYGNRGLRQMNDLDILVKSEHAIKLRKALLKNGFESIPMISSLHEKILPSYGKHLPELYKDGLSVEIHFKLFDQKGNSLTEQFIENSMPVYEFPDSITINAERKTRNPKRETPNAKRETQNAERETRNAEPETVLNPHPIPHTPYPLYHFIYLVKHLAKHEAGRVSQLRLYTDLTLLLPQVINQLVNSRATEFIALTGLDDSLSEKLFLLQSFWDIEIPAEGSLKMNEAEQGKVSERFIQFIRHPKDMRNDEKPDSLLKPLREFEGLWPKVLFITGYLFPSIKFMKYRYKLNSGFAAILYYPVRWYKMLSLIFTRSL
jgi:hypothetical protein